MQQLSNAGMNNANMGRGNAAGGAMNPVAVLQLLQSLQGLSQLAQLTSNLNNSGGGLGAALGSLTGAGGMAGVGGAPGMSDSAASNPLAALSGLGMLGNSLGLGAGTGTGGGSGSLGGGMGSFLQGDSGASGKQVFVRNVSAIFFFKITLIAHVYTCDVCGCNSMIFYFLARKLQEYSDVVAENRAKISEVAPCLLEF